MSIAEKLARLIKGLLRKNPTVGKQKLALIIRASRYSELADAIRWHFNQQCRKEGLAMSMDNTGVAEVIAENLQSGEPRQRARAKILFAKMKPGHQKEVLREIDVDQALIGLGLGKLKKKLKKAKRAIKKAAKAVKKHDFKKDIAVANKIGKVVGPLAASAPPPYGPAIAGACMVLDAADKYNKNAIDQIDTAQLAEAAGIEDSEQVQEIFKVAQNIQNNVKATKLIKAVANKDVEAIAKMKGIKEAAVKGSQIAKGALEALKAAKLGVKMDEEERKEFVQRTAPRKPYIRALMRSSRKIETPAGPLSIINRHKHGAALLLATVQK